MIARITWIKKKGDVYRGEPGGYTIIPSRTDGGRIWGCSVYVDGGPVYPDGSRRAIVESWQASSIIKAKKKAEYHFESLAARVQEEAAT